MTVFSNCRTTLALAPRRPCGGHGVQELPQRQEGLEEEHNARRREVDLIQQRTSEAVQGVAQLADGDLFVVDKVRPYTNPNPVRALPRRRRGDLSMNPLFSIWPAYPRRR